MTLPQWTLQPCKYSMSPEETPLPSLMRIVLEGEEDKEKALLFPDERLATDGKAGVTKEEPSIARDGRL